MEEIPISRNDKITLSTKSQSENNCSDEREGNPVNLNSETQNEGASCSKKDVGVPVGDDSSQEERCDSSGVVEVEEPGMLVTGVASSCDSSDVVKVEEPGMLVTGVASPESCSRNKASSLLGPNANVVVISPVGRSSTYHGVTRHRWSGKYEAHLWDNTCRIEGHRRKGRQVYLGSYDTEEKAARAYDVAALKFWGTTTKLNFPVTEYEKEMEDVRNMSKDACVTYIRRWSSCFSRGTSAFRGVTKRQKDGRWQARIGLVCGSRDIYLGTFKSEEEAAEAYDIAAVKLRGRSAITNFDISNYADMSTDNRE